MTKTQELNKMLREETKEALRKYKPPVNRSYEEGLEDGRYQVYATMWNGLWVFLLWLLIPILVAFLFFKVLNSMVAAVVVLVLWYAFLQIIYWQVRKTIEDKEKATK
jgi:hypothetical protein